MSIATEILAVPIELDHKGKTYKVSLVTQGVKAAFERKFFSKAKDALIQMKDVLSPDEYQDQLRQLQADYLAGEFQFVSKNGFDYIMTVPGAILLSCLLFDCPEEEVLRLFSERQQDVVDVIRQAIRESFPTPEEGDASPN